LQSGKLPMDFRQPVTTERIEQFRAGEGGEAGGAALLTRCFQAFEFIFREPEYDEPVTSF
jgi:hypothetical protein